MRKKSLHINRFLSFVLLWVFSIALTPWSALHHHTEINYSCKNEPTCKHKLHISSHQEQCLVCAAHFETNYLAAYHFFGVNIGNSLFIFDQPVTGGLYTRIIASALRGPPVV